jgi:hypothetical protein
VEDREKRIGDELRTACWKACIRLRAEEKGGGKVRGESEGEGRRGNERSVVCSRRKSQYEIEKERERKRRRTGKVLDLNFGDDVLGCRSSSRQRMS